MKGSNFYKQIEYLGQEKRLPITKNITESK